MNIFIVCVDFSAFDFSVTRGKIVVEFVGKNVTLLLHKLFLSFVFCLLYHIKINFI